MRSCYFPEYWRADPRDACPVRVRTIRLTIGKRRLMFLSVRRIPATSIKTGPLQAPRGNQARAPAFIGTHLIRHPTALLLLLALCNSLLLVASSSRQVSDVMVVPSGSTRTLIE
jgi:hypothetical protein